MNETILLILVAAGVGIFHDENKPIKYELNLEDGSQTHIVLQKSNDYSCPLYCGVDHFHNAVACQNGCNKEHKDYHLHNYIIKAGTAQFGSREVLTINKIKEDKRKIPLVNADRK